LLLAAMGLLLFGGLTESARAATAGQRGERSEAQLRHAQ
jgi:hypothetical protein